MVCELLNYWPDFFLYTKFFYCFFLLNLFMYLFMIRSICCYCLHNHPKKKLFLEYIQHEIRRKIRLKKNWRATFGRLGSIGYCLNFEVYLNNFKWDLLYLKFNWYLLAFWDTKLLMNILYLLFLSFIFHLIIWLIHL